MTVSSASSFTSEPKVVAFSDQPDDSSATNDHSLNFTPVLRTIFSVILSLFSNLIPCDKINKQFIRMCCTHILPYLAQIFNARFDTDCAPSVREKIIPLRKKCPEVILKKLLIKLIKVIDTVTHKLLIFQCLGLSSSAVSFIESYLSIVHTKLWLWISPVQSCVPQGPILSPLLTLPNCRLSQLLLVLSLYWWKTNWLFLRT